HKTKENFSVDPARVVIDMAHNAKIEQDDAAIGRNLQVAVMHVGMEISIAQSMLQEHAQHRLTQTDAVMALCVQGLDVGNWRAFGPVRGHHPPRAQMPAHPRHLYTRISLGLGLELARRSSFQPQVKLASHNPFKMLDNI